MNRLRLIPVVIAAASALLLFKAVGLLTHGGYLLVGTQPAIAESTEAKAPAGGSAETTATTADPTISLATDVNAADTSPTLEDSSVTLPGAADATSTEGGGHGGATADATATEHGGGASTDAQPASADAAHGEAAATAEPAATTCPDGMVPAPAATSADGSTAAPAEAGAPADAGGHGGTADATAVPAGCVPANASGDATPMMTNGGGQTVPVSSATAGSEPQIVERLGERRDALDKRETELSTREDLVKAAEKQLEERAAALKAVEDQVTSKVQEQVDDTGKQMAALITMYETMKPKDAAVILSQLDVDTLVRLTKAMNPKKMALILAKMDTAKAEALTTALAAVPPPTPVEAPAGGQDLTALPQIVGN